MSLQALCIGSVAAAHRGLTLGRPHSTDIDYIMRPEVALELVNTLHQHGYTIRYPSASKMVAVRKGTPNLPASAHSFVFQYQQVEIEVAWEGSTGAELMDALAPYDFVMARQHAPLGVLLALKLSHRFKKNSPHFEKTRRDILTMWREGLEVPESLRDWLVRRETETLAHVHPKLNVSKDGFFNPQEITYVWVHDTIHLAVARGQGYDRPAYESFQEDGAQVKVSRKKFHALPYPEQLRSVIEESYVLALERHQIPNQFVPDPKTSFRMALQKVCTSISSGWWREFAWRNYDAAREAYTPAYVQWLQDGIRSGVVQPFVGGV